MLMDLVCSSCGELMEDAVKNNMRIRVLASDATRVSNVTLNVLDAGACTLCAMILNKRKPLTR